MTAPPPETGITQTKRDVLALIRATHLKANIAGHERGDTGGTPQWDKAWLDGGEWPYAKVPIHYDDPGWNIVVRVYPPARLRKRLAAMMAHG